MDSAQTPSPALDPATDEASQPFVSRWNDLVSTTNWEKGRIIHQWRVALEETEAPATEYSDEAWAQRVGGVTGQHVGRLRRVWQRFGEAFDDYRGLYWSHFHAALDWDDAEMWLEGAVQNGWSVSQLRKQRWETLGAVESNKPQDEEIVASELNEDFEPALAEAPATGDEDYSGETSAEAASLEDDESGKHGGAGRSKSPEDGSDDGAAIYADDDKATVNFVRPFENLAELPDDVSDAFESMKLAILRHKASDWEEISREDMLGAIEALKELALAPGSENAPF